MQLPHDSAVELFIPEKWKHVHTQTYTWMFIAVLSVMHNWKQPRCSSTGKWLKNCGTFTSWNTTQQWTEWINDRGNNLGESTENYASGKRQFKNVM